MTDLPPNRITYPGTDQDFVPERIASESAYGAVRIMVSDIEAQLGSLHDSAATMNINGCALDVRVINLDRPLCKWHLV